jgi:hypothetical protein
MDRYVELQTLPLHQLNCIQQRLRYNFPEWRRKPDLNPKGAAANDVCTLASAAAQVFSISSQLAACTTSLDDIEGHLVDGLNNTVTTATQNPAWVGHAPNPMPQSSFHLTV